MKRLLAVSLSVLLAVGLISACGGGSQPSNDVSAMLEQARHYYDAHDYVRAEEILKEVIASAPDIPEAHFRLGSTYAAMQKWDEAIAEFQEVIRLSPDDADAHSNLGSVYYQRGQLDEAIAAFREALKIKPDDAAFHYNLGAAYAQQNRLSEAEAEFLAAKQYDPDLPEVYFGLGTLYELQGKAAEAREAFERLLELTDDPLLRSEAERHLQNLR